MVAAVGACLGQWESDSLVERGGCLDIRHGRGEIWCREVQQPLLSAMWCLLIRQLFVPSLLGAEGDKLEEKKPPLRQGWLAQRMYTRTR